LSRYGFLERFHFIRRDLIFDKVALHDTPELYRFVHAAYTYEPILMIFGEYQLLSGEGAQQGDPLGSLEFYETIHPLILSLDPHWKLASWMTSLFR